jgi:hypothetical protein
MVSKVTVQIRGWVVSGPVGRQNMVAKRCGETEIFILWQPGNREE